MRAIRTGGLTYFRPDRLDAGSHESAMALMTWVYALLAFVLAANAVAAFDAISKLDAPSRQAPDRNTTRGE